MPTNLHGVQFDFDGCLALCTSFRSLRGELGAFQNGIYIAEAQLHEGWIGPRADDFRTLEDDHRSALGDAIDSLEAEMEAWLDAYVRAADEVMHRRYQEALRLARRATPDGEDPPYIPPPPPVARPTTYALAHTFS